MAAGAAPRLIEGEFDRPSIARPDPRCAETEAILIALFPVELHMLAGTRLPE